MTGFCLKAIEMLGSAPLSGISHTAWHELIVICTFCPQSHRLADLCSICYRMDIMCSAMKKMEKKSLLVSISTSSTFWLSHSISGWSAFQCELEIDDYIEQS